MRENQRRKQKFADLAADLKSPRVVPAIDAALKEIIEDYLDYRALRERAAIRHNVTAPAPAFPIESIAGDRTPQVNLKNPRQAPPTKPIQELVLVAESAADYAWRIIEPKVLGITHAEMREEFVKTPPAQKNKASNGRAYHQALQRLKGSGHVVVEKSRIWASHRLEQFKADLAAGRIADIEDQPIFHGRYAAAVLDYLRQNPGWVGSAQITAHMTALPEFAGIKNMLPQVVTALRNLMYRHKLVEQTGRGKTSRWRAVRNAPEKEQAAEGDLLSTARH